MSLDPKRTMNIGTFLSQVRDRGLSKLNHIAITIKPPLELISILNYKDKGNYLTYYAESVTYPGYEFVTSDFYYGGPPMNVPTRSEYRDVSVTFIVDDNMRQKMFFDAWMNFINPKENKFDFRYREDYIGDINILQISENGKGISYGVKLFEAFPIGMSEIKGSWAEQEPVRIDVTFSYRYWRSLNADLYERSDSDAPELIESIDVIGQKRDKEILESIDVIGNRRDNEVLEGIDVTGRLRETEILESINVTGRRRPSNTPPPARSAVEPKRPARPTRG